MLPEESGVPIDVVAQKKAEDVQKVDMEGKTQGDVEKNEVKGCRSGASDRDARKKDPGHGARRKKGVEDKGQNRSQDRSRKEEE